MMHRHKQAWGLTCVAALTCFLAGSALAVAALARDVRAGGHGSPPPPRPGAWMGARGKISAMSATSITVEEPDSTMATFTISSTTKIVLDGQPSTVAKLMTGEFASVASTDGKAAIAVFAGMMPPPPPPLPSLGKGAFGQISAVSVASITVEKPDSTMATFTISSTTKIVLDGQPSTVAKLMTSEFAAVASTDGKAATGVYARTLPPPPPMGRVTFGQISAVSDTSVTLMQRGGMTATFTISSATKIKVDGEVSEAGDLAEGQFAAVASQDGKAATEIDAGAGPPHGDRRANGAVAFTSRPTDP